MKVTSNSKILYILFLLCFMQASIVEAKTIINIDSLMNVIGSSDGESKLEAYYAACIESATHNNINNELNLLRTYKTESEIQSNAKHEMMARVLRLYAFYNNNLHDSLFLYINDDLKVLERNKQWDYYYSCRSLLVESYRYSNRLQSALKESQDMYDDALSGNNEYGKGVAAYLIASCYQNLNRNTDAIEFFKEAELCMLKDPNVGQLHNLYGIAWNSFVAASQYDELAAMLERWDTMWQNYCKNNNIGLSQIAPYYLVCICAKSHILIDNREFEQARKMLDRAATLSKGQRGISMTLWLKEEARYAEAMGEYNRALNYLDKCYKLQLEHNNRIALVSTQQMRAGILMKLEQSQEAAQIYSELLHQKDSIIQIDMAAQLDDISSIYKVDKLRIERTKLRLWLMVIVIFCVVLLLLLIGYFYYNRRLHAKNRAIYLQYQKQKNSEEFIGEILKCNPAAKLQNKDIELFLQIKKYLKDGNILSNPDLDRNMLAEALGTNYTYISNAIQAGSGISVNAYINQVRIDYACELLKIDTYSIADIQAECGFQSRTSFYRAFKKQMDLSPTEFRRETNN